MPELKSIEVSVKLSYWDAYRSAVILMSRIFRKVLILFGIMGTLAAAVYALALVRPVPDSDWYRIAMENKTLLWVFGLPILFIFVLPLVSARRVVADERVKKGVTYRFSQAGIHVESSVATADLQWAAVKHAIETRSAFMLLPNSNIAHTLPKHCFATGGDIGAMREMLRAKITKAELRNS